MNSETLKPGWTKVKFGEVVRQVKDKVDPETSGLERYIAGEHMDTDDLRIRRWGEIGDDYLGPAFNMRFKPGHVLYGSRRTYLRKVARPDFEGVCANTTFVLESKDPKKLLPELLPFVMQMEEFHSYSIKNSKGSVNPYINFSDLAQFKFMLPTLDEQKIIAKVLISANSLKDNIQEASLLQQSVISSLIEERSRSLCQAGVTKLRKAVTSIEAGKSPKSTGEVASLGKHGVLKVSAVGDWLYIPSENKSISEDDYQTDLEVKAGDFLATRANADPNSVGRTCIVDSSPPYLMLSDKTWRIHLVDNSIKLGVLAWTKSSIFRKHILKKLGGTDAKNISQQRFLDGPFPNCSKADLEEFSNEIESLLLAENTLKKRQQENTKLLKTLINQMMAP